MTAEEAYLTIYRYFENPNNVDLVFREFDSENFGNFLVKINSDGKEKLIVCDRGEIVVYDDANDLGKSRTIVESLHNLTDNLLLDSLKKITI